MVRQNKQDLFFIGMLLAFALIAMTSFTACKTSKTVIDVETKEAIVKADSAATITTTSTIEAVGAFTETKDSVQQVAQQTETIHYDIVRDTLGMPIIMQDGSPMTYISSITNSKKESSISFHSNKNERDSLSATKDSISSTNASSIDSTAVIVEKTVVKEKPATGKVWLLAFIAIIALAIVAYFRRR